MEILGKDFFFSPFKLKQQSERWTKIEGQKNHKNCKMSFSGDEWWWNQIVVMHVDVIQICGSFIHVSKTTRSFSLLSILHASHISSFFKIIDNISQSCWSMILLFLKLFGLSVFAFILFSYMSSFNLIYLALSFFTILYPKIFPKRSIIIIILGCFTLKLNNTHMF